MLEVVGHGVAVTVSSLAETVEIHLHLVIGDKGIFGASYCVALLFNRVEQVKGVTGRLEGIEVGLVFNLSSKVLVAAPQDVGEHLEKVGSVASLLGHHILAFGLPPLLGAL